MCVIKRHRKEVKWLYVSHSPFYTGFPFISHPQANDVVTVYSMSRHSSAVAYRLVSAEQLEPDI
jgi:hypothetical protein